MEAHQDEKKHQQKNKDGKTVPLTQTALMNINCDRQVEEFYNHPDIMKQSVALVNLIEAI